MYARKWQGGIRIVVDRSLAYDPDGCGFESRQEQNVLFFDFFFLHN